MSFSEAFLDSVTLIGSPRFLGSERIAFSDTREHRIHVVDLVSQRVLRIGRHGGGPGEFQMPASLAVLQRGDLLVWDHGLMRLTRFSPEGELVSTRRLEFAVPTDAEILQFNSDTLLFMPTSSMLSGEYYERILFLSMDLQLQSSFQAPCTERVEALEEAYAMGQCNRVLARGADQTVLLADSFTYTVRRYNLEGQLLWDSGALDTEFRAPSSRINTRGEGQSPVVIINPHNGLTRLLELPGRGFVVGGWFSHLRKGAGTTTSQTGFVDFRDSDGKLLHRNTFGSDYVVGDILAESGSLFILVYRKGFINLPDVDVYTCKIDAVKW